MLVSNWKRSYCLNHNLEEGPHGIWTFGRAQPKQALLISLILFLPLLWYFFLLLQSSSSSTSVLKVSLSDQVSYLYLSIQTPLMTHPLYSLKLISFLRSIFFSSFPPPPPLHTTIFLHLCPESRQNPALFPIEYGYRWASYHKFHMVWISTSIAKSWLSIVSFSQLGSLWLLVELWLSFMFAVFIFNGNMVIESTCSPLQISIADTVKVQDRS